MEAHRHVHRHRRDPPPAAPGDLLLHHRSATTTTASTGTSTSTAPSSSRPRPPASCSPRPTRAADPLRLRDGARASARRSTSTCSRARLDMAVDGVRQRRRGGRRRARVPMGPDNPYGNAFTRQRDPADAASREALRDADGRVGRAWHIINPDKPQPARAARRLRAASRGPARRCWPTRTSSIAARAAFATKHLWVTRYDPDERYPAGDFVNQHPGGAGLPACVGGRPRHRRRGHRRVAHLRRSRTSRARRTGR